MNCNEFPSAEHALISRLQVILGKQAAGCYQLGIGDDAAIRRHPDGSSLIVTTDMSVEGVHFSQSYMTMEEIGYRAMVSNLSDCAAMGAVPDGAVIQLVFPRDGTDVGGAVEALYHGFREACDRWQFPVIGGDLSGGPLWMVGITLLGRVAADKRILRRTGALPGDRLWVSRLPGRSAAGLASLNHFTRQEAEEQFPSLVAAHIRPVPRVDLGRVLAVDPLVHAMMDLSDGLSKDCRTLCHENSLGIILYGTPSPVPQSMIQLSKELSTPWQQWYFHGGEEYELLFAASGDFSPPHNDEELLCIGEWTDRIAGLKVQTPEGLKELLGDGFDHLATTLRNRV